MLGGVKALLSGMMRHFKSRTEVRALLPDMLSSYTVNIAYHANNPGVGMALEKDAGRYINRKPI